MPGARGATPGRLHARPREVRPDRLEPGELALELPHRRRALLYVPDRALASEAAPLAVMLHGAGGRGEHMRFTFPWAEEHGCAILAPTSAEATWDVIIDRFGPDVTAIDDALEATFARMRVDPGRLAIGGFSDGASYALSLGTINGDLFTHVLAFSPGFMTGTPGKARPRVFVSHGTRDEVLPIARTSRAVVPRLRAAGYDVIYREFDGPHVVPDAIGRQAFAWFVS